MKVSKLLSLPALALLLVLGLALAMPSAAVAGTKPSCVRVTVRESAPGTFYSKEIATLTNRCSGTKHLKVVWHARRDSSCLTVRPGDGHAHAGPADRQPLRQDRHLLNVRRGGGVRRTPPPVRLACRPDFVLLFTSTATRRMTFTSRT